ncbi:hypothetical protein PoB_005235700 [Plakobranchus ocellatus]|uniref:Uncharacterized protein n=1 Tax=Plakobranchus ocellatus TaxID=259542 RepID=A0AAV4C3B8_9GAST|nr:hypothetical protein PoB_005235700 [Plakobranchus ocellatus]
MYEPTLCQTPKTVRFGLEERNTRYETGTKHPAVGLHRFTCMPEAGDAKTFGYKNSDAVGEWVVNLIHGSNLTSLVSERSESTYLHSRGGLFCLNIDLVSTDSAESKEVLKDVALITCRPS